MHCAVQLGLQKYWMP
uniref:Chitinase homolog LP6 (lp6) protein n=1 Tax=Pinus taeda TaxID=3352 RepID=V9GZQ4_PINTA|nr:hypothetical protein c3 - loblolly pine [Pinus taeda]AAA75097.1 uORFc3; Method: conceptual translation supplied by author [Pinus taeda]